MMEILGKQPMHCFICIFASFIMTDVVVLKKTMQVEILRRRMEGLSNGLLLKRMKEEYGSMLSTANNSVASSASSSQRIESTNLSSSLVQQFYKSLSSSLIILVCSS